jgi:hypothetical protein
MIREIRLLKLVRVPGHQPNEFFAAGPDLEITVEGQVIRFTTPTGSIRVPMTNGLYWAESAKPKKEKKRVQEV